MAEGQVQLKERLPVSTWTNITSIGGLVSGESMPDMTEERPLKEP